MTGAPGDGSGGAVVLRPVIEAVVPAGDAPWPTAPPPADGFLRPRAGMPADEVGLAVYQLAEGTAGPGDPFTAGPRSAVVALLETDRLAVPGGIEVVDRVFGTWVRPGCCCGLEDWREWLAVPDGGEPWLGHDPGPRVAVVGDEVRIWPDGGRGESPVGGHVRLPSAEVRRLLRAVHADLCGFRLAVRTWAADVVPELADALTGRIDRDLRIGLRLL
ncbi:hypothetical protein [Marinitenerispora sediminis]|uniref:Uncharacterized protein n=1 Tax=Marinitenerispora sediminis TaxID=1931232 RepID=A0A368T9Z7_9ACTN|nr:hypothetical protein [Marinitenerispora sediminis]RCV52796.1 hypothetical protein DEF28_12060 [Marinitenerispora sediminis]RCV59901.1 hypothetical protein DEF23_06040 [Marinitenerispora sediminis]RCV61317.1 hypothetical protein DEF24_04575 [Marinitenerispora sediminis]